MEHKPATTVIDADGRQGILEQSPPFNGETALLVRFDDGQQLSVPADALVPQADGSFYLPLQTANISATGDTGASTEQSTQRTVTLPIIGEELQVQKRLIETGIRVSKRVHEESAAIDEPFYQEEIEVEHVPINRQIVEPIGLRQEGDVLVIPVLEEVLVVQKQLWLREEVRIAKKRVKRRQQEQIPVRREEVVIEPLVNAPAATSSAVPLST